MTNMKIIYIYIWNVDYSQPFSLKICTEDGKFVIAMHLYLK